MSPPQLFVDGKQVHLGQRIGKGGEGEVFALADSGARAVKLYSVADLAAREAKIAAIVRLRLSEQTDLVAFPLAPVRDGRGAFAGFVMPLVRGHKPLFELSAPGARKQNFPEADYAFLVHAALNTARAIASVHKAGCVIGDINHSGVLISEKAKVALIDADSFQVTEGGRRHLCRVGVPEYTSPELQGINLGSVARTTNHDAFGLAVVVFQLLAMGRHPFVGAYAKGDLPLPQAIAEHRFSYSRQRNVGMTPPPGAISLGDFPDPLARAFEVAFAPPQTTSRPTAAQWVTLLEEYKQTLRVCAADKLHRYSSAAANCPWCRMESRLGVVLFVPSCRSYAGAIPQFDPGAGRFDLARLWARVEAISIPARSQLTPVLLTPTAQPSAEARAAKGKREACMFASYAAFAAAGVVLLSMPVLWLASMGLVIAGFVLRGQEFHSVASLRQRYASVESEWDRALQAWQDRCGLSRMESLKASLREAKQSFEGLSAEERQKVADYQAGRRQRQLGDYLDRFRIRNVKISGVGPAKEATLASYGIETAAHVDSRRVLAVPGFGPINSRPLLQWRQDLESRFVYDPQPNAVDRAALAAIQMEMSRKATQLRDQMTSDARELWTAAQACEQMRNSADPLLTKLDAAQAQIRADFTLLGIPLPPRPSAPHVVRTRVATVSPTTGAHVRTTTPATARSCPWCGAGMVRRTARRGLRRGRAFWGCSRYPACRGTRPV